MASIQTIQSTDVIANSRADINTNFENLNNDKIETSYLDTDTTLSANSDSKIATQKAVKAYVDAGGNQNASTTQRGIVEEATSAEMIAGTGTGGTGARLFLNPTLVAETGADKIVKTKSTGLLDSSILPVVDNAKYVGVGSSSNTTYNNFQINFISGNGWNSSGSPSYYNLYLQLGSAVGARFDLYDLITGTAMTFANQKIKILEWSALIASDTTTGTSVMGFIDSGVNSAASVAGFDTIHGKGVCFKTNASGAWSIWTSNGSSDTDTSITTPSVGKHTFRIEYNPATPTATFYIDGVSVGTITTTFPTTNNINVSFMNGTSSTIITSVTAPNYSIAK